MIRLIALLILGSALASCARGTYEANVGKVVDMIERSRCRGIEVVAAMGVPAASSSVAGGLRMNRPVQSTQR